MAFIVTTADSYLLSSATNLTNDVYERYMNPKATDKQKMLVLRGTIVVFSFVAVALTLYFPTVLSPADDGLHHVRRRITPAILFALFSKKVTPAGGMGGHPGGRPGHHHLDPGGAPPLRQSSAPSWRCRRL